MGEEREVIYPIYYLDYQKCPKCGFKAVRMYDRIGVTRDMIYPVMYMKCRNCGEEFYVKWIDNPNNEGERIPVSAGISTMKDIIKKIVYAGKADMDKLQEAIYNTDNDSVI